MEEINQFSPEDSSESFLSSASSATSSSVVTWITWYCGLPGHEFFLEIPEDFIEDEFNLTGLPSMVELYDEALDLILDFEPEDEDPQRPTAQLSRIESSAEQLYGLIHQRYILTKQGLTSMANKLQAGCFDVLS
ncbi:casein kinase II regulatory subunit-domain-containing protein [Blyttiomyces helicus]|uniref:Casein kinase II subunit beta n=1 Tax=Blyttiomyces helicus TaxID=388810 RepID=A0A4P9W1X7_9FUNG|nr:casein kinase II regulatory subunit-domain-containing protein [Blyttiomyces helicus]|eukprot:RKO84590.1 casein kinase II regulatory subunit-domain-containing protein [Blyttiomyces helicus]